MNIDALLDKMIQPVIFSQDTINEWIDQWQGKQIFPEAVSINILETLELFRKSSDPAEKEKLALQMFQAKFPEIVKMVQKAPMHHYPQDEHIFAGCYGFWKVLEAFDPANDINFDQFCLLYIKKFMRSIGYNYYVGKLKHKLEKKPVPKSVLPEGTLSPEQCSISRIKMMSLMVKKRHISRSIRSLI